MTKIVNVRFRNVGKVYFFDPGDIEISKGQHLIVDTSRGIAFATAVSPVVEVEDEKIPGSLRKVLRIAGERDEEQEAGNRLKEKEALAFCREKAREHGLEMKLIYAEYTFDNSKILFYFTSDDRVDFRNLVRDLAAEFRTRIELRQIGVRDESKILGGIGICGRVLCCHAHLDDFLPVSIKMAKEQNLSLNPTKISGSCGRLMCCLKHEEETYEELNKNLPRVGDPVSCEDGQSGTVASVNVLRQRVKVLIEDGEEKELKEYPVEELRFQRSHHGRKEKGRDRGERPKKEFTPRENRDNSEYTPRENREYTHRENREYTHRENREHRFRHGRENRDNADHRNKGKNE